MGTTHKLLIIVAHDELYITVHILAEIMFWKHIFNYNCEIVFLKTQFHNYN